MNTNLRRRSPGMLSEGRISACRIVLFAETISPPWHKGVHHPASSPPAAGSSLKEFIRRAAH